MLGNGISKFDIIKFELPTSIQTRLSELNQKTVKKQIQGLR